MNTKTFRPQAERLEDRLAPSAMNFMSSVPPVISLNSEIPAHVQNVTQKTGMQIQSSFSPIIFLQQNQAPQLNTQGSTQTFSIPGMIDGRSAAEELKRLNHKESSVYTQAVDAVFAGTQFQNQQAVDAAFAEEAMFESMMNTHAHNEALEKARFAVFSAGGFGGTEPEPVVPMMMPEEPAVPQEAKPAQEPAVVKVAPAPVAEPAPTVVRRIGNWVRQLWGH